MVCLGRVGLCNKLLKFYISVLFNVYLYIGGFLKSVDLAKIRLKSGCLTVNDHTENKESPNFDTVCPKRSPSYRGVFNQLSQPSNFFAPHSEKYFGYDQKVVRGSK